VPTGSAQDSLNSPGAGITEITGAGRQL